MSIRPDAEVEVKSSSYRGMSAIRSRFVHIVWPCGITMVPCDTVGQVFAGVGQKKEHAMETRFPPFTVTPAAIDEIEDVGGLRLDLVDGGCCGTTYDFGTHPATPCDHVFGCEGAWLVASDDAMRILPGSKRDYSDRDGHPRFRVLSNPQYAPALPVQSVVRRAMAWSMRAHLPGQDSYAVGCLTHRSALLSCLRTPHRPVCGMLWSRRYGNTGWRTTPPAGVAGGTRERLKAVIPRQPGSARGRIPSRRRAIPWCSQRLRPPGGH